MGTSDSGVRGLTTTIVGRIVPALGITIEISPFHSKPLMGAIALIA
jgi:hypothetical protein